MDAHIDLGLSLGDVSKHVGDHVVSRLHRPEPAKPRYIRRAAALVGMGSFSYLTLGGPPIGYYWTVRSITAYAGGDPFANPTGFFAMFVGGPPVGNVPVSDGTFPFMNMADLACINIDPPATVFFSEHSINVFPNDEIVFMFSAVLTNPNQIGCNATMTELPLEPIMRRNTATY